MQSTTYLKVSQYVRCNVWSNWRQCRMAKICWSLACHTTPWSTFQVSLWCNTQGGGGKKIPPLTFLHQARGHLSIIQLPIRCMPGPVIVTVSLRLACPLLPRLSPRWAILMLQDSETCALNLLGGGGYIVTIMVTETSFFHLSQVNDNGSADLQGHALSVKCARHACIFTTGVLSGMTDYHCCIDAA